MYSPLILFREEKTRRSKELYCFSWLKRGFAITS